MAGHVLVGAIEAGLIAIGVRNRRLEIIAHDQSGDPAKEREQRHMQADPIRQPLARPSLGIDIIGGAERGHEQLHRSGDAGLWIEHVDGVACEIHQQLLASEMMLAHRRGDASLPVVYCSQNHA